MGDNDDNKSISLTTNGNKPVVPLNDVQKVTNDETSLRLKTNQEVIKPPKKSRTPKQLEWSRQLGKRSNEFKRVKQEKMKIFLEPQLLEPQLLEPQQINTGTNDKTSNENDETSNDINSTEPEGVASSSVYFLGGVILLGVLIFGATKVIKSNKSSKSNKSINEDGQRSVGHKIQNSLNLKTPQSFSHATNNNDVRKHTLEME